MREKYWMSIVKQRIIGSRKTKIIRYDTHIHLKSRAPVDGPKIHAAVLLDCKRPILRDLVSGAVHTVNILVVTVIVCLTRPTNIRERISAVNPP